MLSVRLINQRFLRRYLAIQGKIVTISRQCGNENKEIYDNLIFIMPPATFAEVYNEIGEPKEGLEKIENYNEAVFWSFSRKDYQKTNWWSKTASANISTKLTIRTANTVRKIVDM